MIETILKNSSHSKDRHVFRARTLLGNAIFDHLTLQKSSVITVDGVQLNGVDHTLPGFCTKEMHYPTESHMARSPASVQVSMDGRGRVFDNIFIERLWRTVKYEHLYLYAYETVPVVRQGPDGYFHFYNMERSHQLLAYQTPAEVHFTCGSTLRVIG